MRLALIGERLTRDRAMARTLWDHSVHKRAISTRSTSAAWHVAHIGDDSVHSLALFTHWLRFTSDLGCDSVHIGATIRPSSAYGSRHVGPRLGPQRTEDSANEMVAHLATTREGRDLDWMVVVSTWSTSA